LKSTLICLFAAMVLCACAGTPFSMSNVRQVKVGMTVAELQATMGSAPYSVTARGETQVWVWSQANGFTGSHQMASFVVKGDKVVSVPTVPASFD